MKIETGVITALGNHSYLDVTMEDFEGFTINELMNPEEAKMYLKDLKDSVNKTMEFLIATGE